MLPAVLEAFAPGRASGVFGHFPGVRIPPGGFSAGQKYDIQELLTPAESKKLPDESFGSGESMEDLKQLELEWEAKGRYGSRAERLARTARWLPYYSLLAEEKRGAAFDAASDPTGFFGVLERENLFPPGAGLLDIGAGTGDYALRFAHAGLCVTALEPSQAAVRVMEERCAAAGIEGVTAVCGTWEEYEPAQTFDVSFLSLCPAVCNIKELEKMEQLTRQTCVIVTVMPGSYDRHRKAMMQELNLHPEGMITDALLYRRVLEARGRRVRLFTAESAHRFTVTKADFMKKYRTYFGIFGLPGELLDEYLERYFERHARRGLLQDESKLCLGMLVWNANGD